MGFENNHEKYFFRKGVFTGLIAAVLVFAGIYGGKSLSDWIRGDYTTDNVSEADVDGKLDQINRIISEYYLYEDEIDKEKLIDGIYSGYTEALGDPYTQYYNEEDTKELNESVSGEFGGIGASMSKQPDSTEIKVSRVQKNSPAEKAGIKEGDIIVSVDGHTVSGNDLDTVASWVKGEPGTEVLVSVMRDGEQIDLTVVRELIEAQTVESSMQDDTVGYIRVTEFDAVTYGQFEEALNDLEEKGMKGLIVDLRNNPGGRLSTVTEMLELLLPEGTIVSTKDKYGNTEEYSCDGTHEFQKPLVVLVNQYSASASEIFAGAVQDYGTGVIVGTTTYGKGVVQQTVDLGDGTCIKVTMAEYYTPSGRSINGTGITPDVEVDFQYDEADPDRDNQLEKAIEIIKE